MRFWNERESHTKEKKTHDECNHAANHARTSTVNGYEKRRSKTQLRARPHVSDKEDDHIGKIKAEMNTHAIGEQHTRTMTGGID